MTSIELHIIQSFPPSNLNRDDMGQPKDSDFGGYRRARVSSQCLKRSIRYTGQHPVRNTPPLFERLTGVPLAKRTHLIVEKRLVPRLMAAGKPEEEARQVALEFALAYSGKMNDKKREETAVLLYMAEAEAEEAVRQLLTLDWPQLLADIDTVNKKRAKKKGADQDASSKQEGKAKPGADSPLKKLIEELVKGVQHKTSAPDVALFGRMLAGRPETNVDAACQVAHAISTHAIANRTPVDYFTAVDDLKDKNDPGAGFLDMAYYTSACFYRYARLDFDQLKANLTTNNDQELHELACRAVEAFLLASEQAIPSGKKGAYAQECRPSFILAVLRASDSPGWSLVNAFQRPINAHEEGDLIVASAARLGRMFDSLIAFYGEGSVLKTVVALPDGLVTPDDLTPQLAASVADKTWAAAICEPLRTAQGV